MKQMLKNLVSVALALSPMTFLGAQVKGGYEPDQIEASPTAPMEVTAQPDGGFSKSIDGTWDCGDLGKMVLTQQGDKVTGTYGEKGKIHGTVTGSTFAGTWRLTGTRSRGSFELHSSIERKTTHPTNLRGKWKKAGERRWRKKRWECSN